MIYNSMAVVIRMSMSCAPFLGTYLPPYRAGWLAGYVTLARAVQQLPQDVTKGITA